MQLGKLPFYHPNYTCARAVILRLALFASGRRELIRGVLTPLTPRGAARLRLRRPILSKRKMVNPRMQLGKLPFYHPNYTRIVLAQ